VGLIKACLNGARAPGEHPALPLTAAQLAAEGAAAVAAGAHALHIHPRDADGRETLAVDDAVRTVQAACPSVPVGVSTGAWIVPDVSARVAAVRAWRAPAMASVNLSEEGHAEVMAALVAAGVGIEAGLGRVQDVAALQASGFADALTRALVEPDDEDAGAAVATAAARRRARRRRHRRPGRAPRLRSGDVGGRAPGQGPRPRLARGLRGRARPARRAPGDIERRADQRGAGALTSGSGRLAFGVELALERRDATVPSAVVLETG
jgi:beta-keto acid cleavage enzyme